MKYCPQCGIPAEDNHRFCVSCGTNFPEYTVNSSAPLHDNENGAYPASSTDYRFCKECNQPELKEPLQDIPEEAPKYKLNYLLLWGLAIASIVLLTVIAIML